MLNLPKDGDRVKVWPMPGRGLVQASSTPIGDGGMAIHPEEGHEITWGPFAYRQLLHGDIVLHDPVAPAAPEPDSALAELPAEDAVPTIIEAEPEPLPPPPVEAFDDLPFDKDKE